MSMQFKAKYLLVVLLVTLLFTAACGQLGVNERKSVDIVAGELSMQRNVSLLSLNEYSTSFSVNGNVAELAFATDVGRSVPASVAVVNGKAELSNLVVDSYAKKLIVTAKDSAGRALQTLSVDLYATEQMVYIQNVGIEGLYIWDADREKFIFYSLDFLAALVDIDDRVALLELADASDDTRVVLGEDFVFEWLDYLANKMAGTPLVDAVPAEEDVIAIEDLIDVDVDKEELENLLEELAELNAEDYTEDSWAAFEIARDDAQAVFDDEDATQADVDAAIDALTEAKDALVTVVDADLAAAKEEAEALNPDNYTAESFAALQVALALPEDTDEEKVAKTEAIHDAIANLVLIPDPEVMELVLEAVDGEGNVIENPVINQNVQGTAGVNIRASVKQNGVIITGIDDMGVVNFTRTIPNLTQIQSTLEEGETTVGYVPIQVQETVMVRITGTIANSPIPGLNGMTAEVYVQVNPITGETEIIARNTITAVNATQADRATLYFRAENFNVGDLNPANFVVLNRGRVAEPIPVLGFRAIREDAVEAILDVNVANRPMHDNARHNLVVARGFFEADNIPFDLEDTDHLSAISAVGTDQLTVVVTFSEAVYNSLKTGPHQYQANDPAKYMIDGVRLSNIPGATVTVGTAAIAPQPVNPPPYNSITADRRHIVTIKLPPAYALTGGDHVLQISNVGEWAASTDGANRLITQTLTFNVTVDNVPPVAYLTQHSPEQYLVTFSKQLIHGPDFVHIDNAQRTANTGANQVRLTEDVYDPDLNINTRTYTVTEIPEARARALQNMNHPQAVGPGYLIEVNTDWTVIYDTVASNVNYWNSTVNPYTLRIDGVEDLLGNAQVTGGIRGRQEIQFTIPRDQVGPVLADGVEIAGRTYVVNQQAQQVWLVEANEPVQIPGLTHPGITPSQTQEAQAGVPVPEIEFSKGDKQKEGRIIWVSDCDMMFHIQPFDGALDEVGEWQVSIAAITDDVGNSQDTKIFNVQIYAAPDDPDPVLVDPVVIWADAHWNTSYGGGIIDDDHDWVHVKFNKNMAITGLRSVLRTQNWTIQGYDLPIGSDIVAGIPFVVGTQYDAITIRLPKNWLADRTGGDVFVNHRDLECADGRILVSNRINLDQVGVTPNAEYRRTAQTIIPVHMPQGAFNNDLIVLQNGAYIYGHGAEMIGGRTLTIGDGTTMNATVRDLIVPNLVIDVGQGTVNLINVTAGTTTILSAGPNSVNIVGGEYVDIVIAGNNIRIRVTPITPGTKVKIDDVRVDGENILLDIHTDTDIVTVTVGANGSVTYRNQNGVELTPEQVGAIVDTPPVQLDVDGDNSTITPKVKATTGAAIQITVDVVDENGDSVLNIKKDKFVFTFVTTPAAITVNVSDFVDNEDGTYSFTFTPSAKGIVTVTTKVLGVELKDKGVYTFQ